MITRYLITRRGCPHCREFKKAIWLINLRLPIDKKIKIIDCHHWEKYGILTEPIMKKFEKDGLSDGYPLCFISKNTLSQGVLIQPSSPDVLKVYLSKFLEDEIR